MFAIARFRSHFLSGADIDAAGGPAAYVLALLDEAAQSPQWRTREDAMGQLTLF